MHARLTTRCAGVPADEAGQDLKERNDARIRNENQQGYLRGDVPSQPPHRKPKIHRALLLHLPVRSCRAPSLGKVQRTRRNIGTRGNRTIRVECAT